MKKIIQMFFTLLIIFSLPVILPAAQKTTATHQISPTATYPNNPDSPYNTTEATAPAAGTVDRYIGVTKTGLGTQPIPEETSTPTPITDPGTTTSFPPIVNNTSSPSITVDSSTGAINMGSAINDGSGALWYGGTSPVGTCNPCTNGVCTFGLGFRVYFEFKYTTLDSSTNSSANADGFTFTVMNADNNKINYRGGAPTTTFSLGELMGYAGSGNTSTTSSSPHPIPPDPDGSPLDGLGLKPPKFAIEFDTYPNPNAMQYNGCSGNRNDHNNNNHIALMFWGTNPSSGTMCSYYSTAGSTYPRASFDDNVHGVGDGTTANPYNSAYSGNGSGLGGYYERSLSENGGTYNWMEDGKTHRVRIEVIRISSSQSYQVKVWVDCESCSDSTCACPAGEYTYFQDVYNPYTHSTYLPKIDRTQQLSSTYNAMLDNILFGFTEGTGASTQQFSINNFAIYFPTSSISPASRAHTYNAASGQTVSVTAASSSCTWTANVNANTPWLTITSGTSGTGSGTVTYSIAANSGAARTGYIIIAGQTFTVTQAAGPPSCTLMAASNIIPYNSTNTLTWTVNGTATGASWISSPGGTCGSPNPAGGSCTTAAQTTAGARTYTLNVSNAAGSSSCSSTFYVGCSGYTVYNNTGSRRDFRITNSSCSRTNNGSAISGTLNTGETVTRYGTNNRSCGSAQGSFGYTDAMNVDILFNGGDGDCQVNYNSNDTATDR